MKSYVCFGVTTCLAVVVFLVGCKQKTPPVVPIPLWCVPNSGTPIPAGQNCARSCATHDSCRACCDNSGMGDPMTSPCKDSCPGPGRASVDFGDPAFPEQLAGIYAAIPSEVISNLYQSSSSEGIVLMPGDELVNFIESLTWERANLVLEGLQHMTASDWRRVVMFTRYGLESFTHLVEIDARVSGLNPALPTDRHELYLRWFLGFMDSHISDESSSSQHVGSPSMQAIPR